MRQIYLDVIPFKGVPEFKQVQMYKTYRQFLPPEYQDLTCPKQPSNDVLKRQKDDQTQRAQNKRRKIGPTTTEGQHDYYQQDEEQNYLQDGAVFQSV